MRNEYFMKSLFPTKGDFDRNKFWSDIKGTGVITVAKLGVLGGFKKTQDNFSDGEMSFRLQSDYMHEAVYNSIQQLSMLYMPDEHLEFAPNQSGNERLFFKYKDYIFIIKLEGSSQNDTKSCNIINNQDADYHIITIAYSLGEMRNEVKSVSLQYIIGKYSLYSYYIPLDEEVYIPIDNDNEIAEVKKPKLKIVAKNSETV